MSTSSEPLAQQGDVARQRSIPLWRNRDYILLMGGQGVSAIGSQVSWIAFPLLIFVLTHSAAQTGLITAVRSLPYVVFMLPAGAIVDRIDRKRLMIFCDSGRALALGSIPIALALGHLTYLQLYIASLVEGTLYVFFTVANFAALPRIVEQEQLATAKGQDEMVSSLASMIGPALAPILYAIGSDVPFLVDAVSYVVSVISLCFMKVQFQADRTRDDSSHLLQEIREGLVWLWHQPLLRFLAILTFGLITPCYGYVLLIIVLGQHLHATSVALGLIFASSGVGSVVGALVAAPLYKRFGFSKVLIVSAWLWALLWLLYALAPTPLILGIINALSFTVVPVYMVVQDSYRLSVIPDALQGRVNSVFQLIAFSGQPLGMAVTGLLLQLVGPVLTIVILFIPQAILALAATFNRHVLQVNS